MKTRRRREKGVYICWLFHVVGDLHQPLHSSALFSQVAFPDGDRGGNLIRTNAGNLHSFWDGLLGRNIDPNDVRLESAELRMNDEMVALGETALEDLNPEVWAEEGHELCEEFVYSEAIRAAVERREEGSSSIVESVNLPNAYMTEAGTRARRRVVEAGFRLGSLLKEVAAAQPRGNVPERAVSVRITGLLPDPDGLDSIGETIRLRNMIDEAVDLSGWKVRDDDGDELLLSGMIEPGQQRDIVDSDNDVPLGNRGDVVELVNPAGTVVHRVEYSRSDVARGEFISF